MPIAQSNTGTSANGTVTITPAGLIFVDVGRTRQMVVTVTSDPANQGVTWALSGPGSLSNITTTTATYNGSMNPGDSATITVTGVANPSEIASASLYMVPLPTITTTTLPGGTVGTIYNGTVTGENGAPPFNWSVSSGSFRRESLSPRPALIPLSSQGAPLVRAALNMRLADL